eukprot:5330461-Amphidinium_carterae.1
MTSPTGRGVLRRTPTTTRNSDSNGLAPTGAHTTCDPSSSQTPLTGAHTTRDPSSSQTPPHKLRSAGRKAW